MTKFILTDIEGATTYNGFTNNILSPYSIANISDFIYSNTSSHEVLQCLYDAQEYLQEMTNKKAGRKEVVQALTDWIGSDVKQASLKKLQAMLWKKGYELGELKGHVYPDVPLAFERWMGKKIQIGTYSKNPIDTQRLLLKYSVEGDLTTYISAYFDTAVGEKTDIFSYFHVADKLHLAPNDIIFISASEEELECARKSGMGVILCVRKDAANTTKIPRRSKFLIVNSFDEVDKALS